MITAEELEAFRQTADDAQHINTFWSGQYAWTVARLLAEVERLRAREAALLTEHEQAMAVVRAVAQGDDYGSSIEFEPWGDIDTEWIVNQARALLTQIPNASEA